MRDNETDEVQPKCGTIESNAADCTRDWSGSKRVQKESKTSQEQRNDAERKYEVDSVGLTLSCFVLEYVELQSIVSLPPDVSSYTNHEKGVARVE